MKIKNLNQALWFFVISLLIRLLLHVLFLKLSLINCDRLWKEYLFLYFPSHLPVFFLGIILYFFVTEKSGVKMISPLLILLFSGMFIAQLTTGVDFMPHHIVFSIALLFFAFSLSVYQFKLFVNPVINYLGKLSYSMYLIHFAVIHWVDYFGLSDLIGNAILDNVIRFLIVLVPTVLISTVSYKLIELPFQNLGKRLIEKMEQKSVSQL